MANSEEEVNLKGQIPSGEGIEFLTVYIPYKDEIYHTGGSLQRLHIQVTGEASERVIRLKDAYPRPSDFDDLSDAQIQFIGKSVTGDIAEFIGERSYRRMEFRKRALDIFSEDPIIIDKIIAFRTEYLEAKAKFSL